jgi:predicted ATP-dependent endonuclease of OLD family
MKLSKLRLQNFRCYKDEIQVDFSDITALVGRNDSGKSSLMDALDIFLNDGAPDKDDASDSDKSWEDILPEKQKEKESKVKKALCGEAARMMTSELLSEVDPNCDVHGWFADMKRLIDTD